MSQHKNTFPGHTRGVVLINSTAVLHVPSLYPDACFDAGTPISLDLLFQYPH